MPAWSAVRRYDLERGRFDTRSFGPGSGAGEPLFIPRSGASAEDDGWVIVLVYDATRNASDFYVLDARNIAGEPVATVRLPHRVPYGFHGNWVPA
jgi:carotenoid cleavage dioxygenase